MKNVLLCFGGNSTEHEISLISAQNIINNIDENKYNIFKVYISLNCQWKYVKDKKIGRNDPCPCGSGKKYKKCCQKA